MKNYNLTIFNQSRMIAIVFLAPVFFLGSFIAGLELVPKSYFWVITIPMIVAFSGLLYYFARGDINVIHTNDTLTFKWKKKLIFNYAEIAPIPVNEIKTIVVDQGQLLRKIITSDRVINLSNSTILMKDSQAFIKLLTSIAKENKGRVINSWDVWKEKGIMKWALRINAIIIILIIGLILVYGILKGFDKIPPASFFSLITILPMLIMYQRQMKQK